MERPKKVSIKDVARESGVSPTTVSVILNGRWEEFRIAPATRDHVVATARRLGYHATRSAKPRTSTTPAHLWCIFAPVDFHAGPTVGFFQGVRTYTESNHLDVETILFPYERGRLADKAPWMTSAFTSGAIMVGLNDEDVAFLEDAELDIPIVLFNRVAKQCSSVNIDDYGVGQNAMRHFLSRGRTRAAVISPQYSSRPLSLRSVGLADELRQALGDEAPEAIAQVRAENSYSGGYSATRSLLADGPAPSAIFVLNDQMVGGVMHCLEENGLTVPDDVDVISYGDTAINTLLRPTVTSFAVPVPQMSYECARTLHNATLHPQVMDKVGRVFDADLVLRQRLTGTVRAGVAVSARPPQPTTASDSIWSRGFVSVFVINLAINMAQFMMNTLVPKLAVVLGASSVMVGLVSGMFAVTALSVRPVVGPATMRLRKNHLLAGTVAVILLAFVLYSISDDVSVLIAARLLHGAGMGFLAPVTLALASENLPERRMASGIGIFSLGQAVATAAGPSVGLALLSVAGYRWTFLIGAGLMAGILVLALRVKTQPHEGTPRWQFSRSTFIAREALVPAIVMFFLAGAYSGVNSFIVLYGESLGITGIGLFFTAYAVCVLVSRPVAGRIGDRHGLSWVIIPGMAIFGVAFVAISNARTLTDFVIAGGISAFGYGICQPALQTLSLMSVDQPRRGVAGNTSYMGVDLGYLLMPVAAGWVVSLVERQGTGIADAYSVMYRVMVIPVLVGLVLFLVFGRKVARRAAVGTVPAADPAGAVDD